jgi:hypothetical protein
MGRTLRSTWTQAVMLALLTAPAVANACAVCVAGQRRALMAYFGTAVLLSVLPFVLFGGVAWWFFRQTRKMTGSEYATGVEGFQRREKISHAEVRH